MDKETEIVKRLMHKDVYKVSLINTNDYVFCGNTDNFLKFITSFGNMKYIPKKSFLQSFDKYYNNPIIYVYRDVNDYREICTNKILPVLDYKKIEAARKSNDMNKKVDAWISYPCGILLEDKQNTCVIRNQDVKNYIFDHYMNSENFKNWQDFLDYRISLANSNVISYLNQQIFEHERKLSLK